VSCAEDRERTEEERERLRLRLRLRREVEQKNRGTRKDNFKSAFGAG
jgi:hypothetical protein